MNHRPCFSISLSILFSFAAARPALAGHVLVVDSGGGGSYTQIQPAIDAALDGDTILVKAGTYYGFTIDNKELSVVGDAGASVTITSPVRVDNLAALREVLLAGLQINLSWGWSQPALGAQNDSGSLRVESCTILAAGNGMCSGSQRGADLANDHNVAFRLCTIQGGLGVSSFDGCPGGDAIRAQSCSVALYVCILLGGNGGDGAASCSACTVDGGDGGAGGAGYEFVAPGFLFASGTSFQGGTGGRGGDGCSGTCFCNLGGNGGDGGDGFHAASGTPPYPLFAYLDSSLSGGVGGPGGSGGAPPVCDTGGSYGAAGSPVIAPSGSVSALSGQARSVSLPPVVRENIPFSLDFRGQPGDIVWVFIGQHPHFAYNAPFHGVNLTTLPPLARIMKFGTIPASGTLTAQRVLPDLGVDSQVFYLQAVFRASMSQRFLANQTTLVELDSAY